MLYILRSTVYGLRSMVYGLGDALSKGCRLADDAGETMSWFSGKLPLSRRESA
jgi:hypothetical protein